VYEVDELLNSGGLMNMMYSISLAIIAMMFGGVMEGSRQLEVIVDRLKKLAKTPASLVTLTEATCVVSNVVMPEQYISIVVPGRMYAEEYEKMKLHPKTLSNALESAGTVTSALVPWNTCGVFMATTLGLSTISYAPWAIFNWLMPIVVVVMAFMGLTVAGEDGARLSGKKKG
jgi:NhaC family Na+:H+ antiporter